MTKYHFVGIKGSGMSALAQVLDDMGYSVQGSDVDTFYFTQKPLEERGIHILPFEAENIEDGMCVIASNAFTDEHEEIAQCLQSGVPLYRYHQFLGEFVQGFTSIAVTGAHGKTSTTGLLAHVLQAIRPTSYLIGDGTGKGVAKSQYFAFEACEYRRHFLAYQPDYMMITNIDFDHPDYFRGVEDVIDAFDTLSKQVKKKIIAWGDDPYIDQLKPSVPILNYGLSEQNQLYAKHIEKDITGVSFDVFYEGTWIEKFTIPQFGMHNVLNALAVIALCISEGLQLDMVKERLRTFKGVKRRFSEKKVLRNILIDDYAHHPTEIKATIETVRAKYPDKKVVAIFQPHTFSRTEIFLDEFAESLTKADEVYLCDIFSSAREQKGNLTIQDLIDKISFSKYISIQSVTQLNEYADAILLFMGAGDIQKVQHAFEESLTMIGP